MLKRCIMIFPEFKNMNLIDQIREKYDPLAKHVRPHITLVFPFESNIKTNELKEHLLKRLEGIKPFYLSLKGIVTSRANGNYIFLNIEDGKEKIIELHNNLYTGILEDYIPDWLRKVEYFPHMTVGNVANEDQYIKAIEETKNFNHVFETIVDTISVEIIDENEDSIIELNIPLG
ncbi:hypothetical protein BHF71_07235 [Vulcanibacillus modesticaldus]|uniref:2'-5' RNA ligase n=1 Tax=Vulcanibacillus modesticaldus TaxID=337097 RepID=A0A1D2YW71_9BACI|nr:2'-5' RNA ligase family protein [Vulcanibacillus modesticaldus]OEF99897.1 hypothetical protein BHF71_07235 [Vulcanibacillus modesticaldus]